jgi:hypothetical protein
MVTRLYSNTRAVFSVLRSPCRHSLKTSRAMRMGVQRSTAMIISSVISRKGDGKLVVEEELEVSL